MPFQNMSRWEEFLKQFWKVINEQLNVHTIYLSPKCDMRNIDHQTWQKWSKQINENEKQLLDQMDSRYWIIFSRQYRWRIEISFSKWCLYRVFRKICSTAITDIWRIICALFFSLFLFHNNGSSNKFPEQNLEVVVRTILGNFVYNPTFREFFPVVKRFVPLKNTRDSFARILFITKRWKVSPVGKIKSGSTRKRNFA